MASDSEMNEQNEATEAADIANDEEPVTEAADIANDEEPATEAADIANDKERATDAASIDESPDGDGRTSILFLLVAFATVLAILIGVVATRAWDGYLCDTDDDCRGLKVCHESECVSPEIWQRQHSGNAPTTE